VRLVGWALHCRTFSRQFGLTSAPIIPQLVHTMRGPNDGTVTSPGRIDVHDPLVPALMALDRERPHAVVPHVREVHRLDRIIEQVVCHCGAWTIRQFCRKLTSITPRLVSKGEMKPSDDPVS
jgi:hypothetical protein